MRMSRVLLAGVGVAAAVAATSAFTASNTLPISAAGFGQNEVTGATVTDIHYIVNDDDGTVVDAVEFTTTTNVTNSTWTMTLKSGATNGVGGIVVGDPYPCTIKTPWTTSMVLTCDTSGTVRNFEDFNAVGLTVVD